MKTIGRMNLDSPLSNTKTGEVRWAKNRIVDINNNYSMNEGGCSNVLELQGHTFLGTILIDENQILFANYTNLGTTWFCIYDWNGIQLKTILKTLYITFNNDEFIEGTFQYNNKKERIICFWNGINSTSNASRLLNIDNLPFELTNSYEIESTINNSASELALLTLLTPPRNEVQINTTVEDYNGLIKTGKYSFNITYLIGDDEVNSTIPTNSVFVENFTNWNLSERFEHYLGFIDDTGPILNNYLHNYKYSKPDEVIPKSIELEINNLDRRYTRFHLNIIHYANGATTVSRIKNIYIDNSSKTIRYSGNVDETNIALEKVLDTRFIIDKIQTGGILRDRLYIAGFTDDFEINYQKYANNIKTRVIVEGTTNTTFLAINSFVPDEAYAFYIHFVSNNGKISKGFHIPGREAIDDELEDFYDLGHTLNTPCKKFHAGLNYNVLDNTGYWQNEDILYSTWKPENLEIWDENGNTGNTLIDNNAHVRLIRMPSVNAMKNILPSTSYHARYCYPEFSNIYIPPALATMVQGYIITYAKKNNDDMHVFGYGGAIHRQLFAFGGVAIGSPHIRYYGFDNLSVKNTPILNFCKEVGYSNNASTEGTGVGLPNTTYPDTTIITADYLYPIKTALYRTSNDANTNLYSNQCLNIELHFDIDELHWHNQIALWNGTDVYSTDLNDVRYVHHPYRPCLGNISNIVIFTQELNLHKDLHNQTLCATDWFFKTTSSGVYNTTGITIKGDCEVVTDTIRLIQDLEVPNSNGLLAKFLAPMPIRTYNRIPNRCREFPKYPGEYKYFIKYDRDYYYNQYEVYVEAKKLNTTKIPAPEPINNYIFNYNRKTIIRSTIYNPDTNSNNWREFYPLNSNNLPNYLILPSDVDKILHVEIGIDKIYIQCYEGLYIAQFKSQITTAVSLQEADIFDIAPTPIKLNNKNIQCQHKKAALLTPLGYAVVDKINQNIYLIGEEVQDISKQGINTVIWGYLNKCGYSSKLNDTIGIAYDNEYNNLMLYCVYRDTKSVVINDISYSYNVIVPNQPITYNSNNETAVQLLPIGGDDMYYAKYSHVLATINNVTAYYKIYRNYGFDNFPFAILSTDYITLENFSYKGIAFRYNQGWISYNTHNANYIYSHFNNLYSMGGYHYNLSLNDRIYLLNNYLFCGLYQNRNKSVEIEETFIDYIFNITNVETFTLLKNFMVKTISSLNKDYRDGQYVDIDTFDDTIDAYGVYNNFQSSGKITITDKINKLQNNITHNYTDWNISEFKDILIDSNLDVCNEKGELINIDNNKMWYDKGNFIDSVVVIRVYIRPEKLVNRPTAMQPINMVLRQYNKKIKITDIDINIKPFIK